MKIPTWFICFVVAFLAAPGYAKFINLSSRVYQAPRTDQVPLQPAISGVTVSGSTPKHLVFRAVGQGLRPYVQPQYQLMSGPRVVLYDMAQVPAKQIAVSAAISSYAPDKLALLTTLFQSVGAFPVAPSDSVLDIFVKPGQYTAVMSDATGGLGIIEVYDADPLADSELVNISTRGQSWPGYPVGSLIAGFVSNADEQALLRVVGPGLLPFQVPDAMPYPSMTLYRSLNGASIQQAPTLARWDVDPVIAPFIGAAARQVGAFDLQQGRNDCAALFKLPAGAWTIVAGSVGTVADDGKQVLVEIYKVPK